MKNIVILLLLLTNNLVFSQNLSANYSVVKIIDLEPNEGINSKTVALKFDGFFYKKGNTYISFLKPLYLDKYPKGTIEYSPTKSFSSNEYHSFLVSSDTIQNVEYVSIDSLLKRNRVDGGLKLINKKPNAFRYFEIDYQKWEILPDVKTIQGLKCQRAKWINTLNGSTIYDVWFCADIPTMCNFNGLIGLPGLIVDGESNTLKIKFQLQNYQLNAFIDNATMWPVEFNEGFRLQRPIKKIW